MSSRNRAKAAAATVVAVAATAVTAPASTAVIPETANVTSIAAAAPTSIPAKGPGSPVHQQVIQQKTLNTPAGRKTRVEAILSKVPIGWHIRSVLVEGGLELIFLTLSNFHDDCFGMTQLSKFIKKRQEDNDYSDPVMQIGLLGQYYLRKSLKDPDRLLEKKGPYQRKVLVRVLDPGEETPEKRFDALQAVKKFLENKKHNQYEVSVHLNFNTFDQTPSVMPKLDHYVQWTCIVKILQDIFPNVDNNWAAHNIESALTYLTEGYIPIDACQELGFPKEYVMAEPVGMEK